MTNLPRRVPAARSIQARPCRQLSMSLEAVPLQGIAGSERAKIIAHLANILLEAGGAMTEELDHGKQ